MNVLLGTPIYSDASVSYSPSLSGGSWSASLPLTNLQDRRLHKVARSSDAAVASTKIRADLGVARSVRVIALLAHNFTTAVTVRHRGFSMAPFMDQLDFSTGWSDSGTPTRSAAAFTCADGIPLDLIGDDSAVAREGKTFPISVNGDGVKTFDLRIKAGSSTSFMVDIDDATAPATVGRIVVSISGGVPTASASSGATVLSTTLVETGVYRIVFKTGTITAAHTNTLRVFPASDAAGDVTRTGDLYIGVITGWDAATDQLVYDTGYFAGWPSGVTAEGHVGYTPAVIRTFSSAQSARYWWTDIVDTTNTDSYVEFGRLVIAGGFVPTINFAPGARLGFEDPSTREETDGGSFVFNEREGRRVAQFHIEDLPLSEGMQVLDMQAQLGAHGQLLAVLDPDDTTNLHRQSFLCTMRELSPLETKNYQRRNPAFSLVEEL